MEELEQPQEHVQEQIHEGAHHAKEQWIFGVALTAALLAALAAIASAISGHHEHEAMLEMVKASDQWNYYQAEGIKQSILEGRSELADAVGGKKPPVDKIKKYEEKRAELKIEATKLEEEATQHDHKHMVVGRGVTLFQVAIAIAAISVLTKRKSFWGTSIVIGLLGIVFFIAGMK